MYIFCFVLKYYIYINKLILSKFSLNEWNNKNMLFEVISYKNKI